MVVGEPSPVPIIKEVDIHVCSVPISTNNNNNINQSIIDPTPASLCTIISPLESISHELSLPKIDQCLINLNDLPFDLLAGEEFREHGHDSSDGIIYLTTYRLFVFTNESSCSFINCPIRLIDSIEMKDNIYLYIQCKDFRSFRLIFLTAEKCCYWLRKLTEIISTPTSIEHLFAIKFALAIPNQEHTIRDHFQDEISRLQLDTEPWRITEINRHYKLCTSYPEYCVVPKSITDSDLAEVAKFRSYRRFPTIVWR